MFHAYLRNKFSIVRLLNRPDKNQDYKVTDFLRKKPKAESTILLSNATNSKEESRFPDACNGTGYRHCGKARTRSEGIILNSCDGTGYRH